MTKVLDLVRNATVVSLYCDITGTDGGHMVTEETIDVPLEMKSATIYDLAKVIVNEVIPEMWADQEKDWMSALNDNQVYQMIANGGVWIGSTKITINYDIRTLDATMKRNETSPKVISSQDLHNFGYHCSIMQGLTKAQAVLIYTLNECMVYRLYEDDTEGAVGESGSFPFDDPEDTIYGVELEDLDRLIKKNLYLGVDF